MSNMDWPVITAAVGALGNIIWMLATLAIKNQIGTKIDSLKDWMDLRYVPQIAFNGYQQIEATRLAEIDSRMASRNLEVDNRLEDARRAVKDLYDYCHGAQHRYVDAIHEISLRVHILEK